MTEQISEIQKCPFCEMMRDILETPGAATPEDRLIFRMHYKELHGVDV
jgi:hypothetical protein